MDEDTKVGLSIGILIEEITQQTKSLDHNYG